MTVIKITDNLHEILEAAFTHFNDTLFNSRLPKCMLITHRKKNIKGHFWANEWKNHDTNEGRHEIALNPDIFKDEPTECTLSTLVHEMVHLQQQVFGTPGKNGYHNNEWKCMMLKVGLLPYPADDFGPEFPEAFDAEKDQWPECKGTGVKVTHEIVPGAAFDKACNAFLKNGYEIQWTTRERPEAELAIARIKRASKTKFTCPNCKLNAWAKPDAVIGCWICGVEMYEAI